MARTAARSDADERGVRWEVERQALLRQAARVTASPAPGVALPGVLSRGLLDAVAGGQPLLLHHGGRLRAVLLDADTWAELEALAELAG